MDELEWLACVSPTFPHSWQGSAATSRLRFSLLTYWNLGNEINLFVLNYSGTTQITGLFAV
jgi:hypothetical protein